MEMFKKYMLGRYQEKSFLTKMFNVLYILVLGFIFLGYNPISEKIVVSILFVLFISREIIDSIIRKDIQKATYNQYFYSILLSIVESAVFMISMFLVFDIDILGFIIAIFLAIQINIKTQVLLEFRRLYKEKTKEGK